MDAMPPAFSEKLRAALYPWQALFTQFNKPDAKRIKANVALLYANYTLVMFLTTFVFLMTMPLFFIIFVFCCGAGVHASKNKQSLPSDPKILYGVPAAALVILVLCTNMLSLFLAGLGLGAAACGAHAATFDPPPDFNVS